MFLTKTNVICNTSLPINCKKEHADPSIISPAAAYCGLFCYFALSLASSFSNAICWTTLRLGVVRYELVSPRTHHADATSMYDLVEELVVLSRYIFYQVNKTVFTLEVTATPPHEEGKCDFLSKN